MASNYPVGLDNLLGNQPYVDDVTVLLSAELNTVQDAVDALQEKVGIDSSAAATSHDYKIATLEAAPSVNIKAGTYTGNADATQAITGVGFEPDALFIFRLQDGLNSYYKDKNMGVNAFTFAAIYGTSIIDSLDGDGFTVNGSANANGGVFSFLAIKEA